MVLRTLLNISSLADSFSVLLKGLVGLSLQSEPFVGAQLEEGVPEVLVNALVMSVQLLVNDLVDLLDELVSLSEFVENFPHLATII